MIPEETATISQRLRQLRLVRGMTLDALAAALGGIVTKQALSKYERGKMCPSAVVLNKLAAVFRVKSAYLWSEPLVTVKFIAYRKGSGLRKREQAKVEVFVRQALEDRVHLQELVQEHNGTDVPVQEWRVRSLDDAENAAGELRSRWNLGSDPIASVTGVLEDHHIHVLEIDARERFDGISAVASGDAGHVAAAAVVSRRGVPGERQRLNLAHELGHLALKPSKRVDEEKAAFRFGAAFLVPASAIRREIGTTRTYIQTAELFLLKRRFRVSIQSLLYRFRDLGIISEHYYRQWCMDINRTGWRKREPEEQTPERPQWLRQNVLRAFAEGLLSASDAERMLGKPIEVEQPLSLVERHAFMKLPLDERRRRMVEQADRVAEHYERSTEWRSLEGADLVGD